VTDRDVASLLEALRRLTNGDVALVETRISRVLLAEFDELVARLRALEPPFETWHAARRELALLLEHLEKHEEAETGLVH
jgi:hypothetical protein